MLVVASAQGNVLVRVCTRTRTTIGTCIGILTYFIFIFVLLIEGIVILSMSITTTIAIFSAVTVAFFTAVACIAIVDVINFYVLAAVTVVALVATAVAFFSMVILTATLLKSTSTLPLGSRSMAQEGTCHFLEQQRRGIVSWSPPDWKLSYGKHPLSLPAPHLPVLESSPMVSETKLLVPSRKSFPCKTAIVHEFR